MAVSANCGLILGSLYDGSWYFGCIVGAPGFWNLTYLKVLSKGTAVETPSPADSEGNLPVLSA